MKKYIRNFESIEPSDRARVGEKNAALGDMFRHLQHSSIAVPNGFAILNIAYQDVIAHNHIGNKLDNILNRLDRSFANLHTVGRKARQTLLDCTLPYRLQVAVLAAYEQLREREDADIRLAVRSSLVLPESSPTTLFRQQDSFLNIHGANPLLDACLHCYASLYSDRAIQFRAIRGYDHRQVSLSIGVQRMVRSDRACSGLGFVFEVDNHSKKMIQIQSSWGLGLNLIRGKVEPDEFTLLENADQLGELHFLYRKMGSKNFTLQCNDKSDLFSTATENRRTPEELQQQWTLSNAEVKTLANWGKLLEAHYSKPIFFEWAKDGISQKLYLVQVNSGNIPIPERFPFLKKDLKQGQFYRSNY